MVIKTKAVRWFRAGAIAVWPFIFIDPDGGEVWTRNALVHERVHHRQQLRWLLLPWYILYLLVLPVGWNPFRAKWEREAYRAQGFRDAEIDHMLRKPPYYLWWM